MIMFIFQGITLNEAKVTHSSMIKGQITQAFDLINTIKMQVSKHSELTKSHKNNDQQITLRERLQH